MSRRKTEVPSWTPLAASPCQHLAAYHYPRSRGKTQVKTPFFLRTLRLSYQIAATHEIVVQYYTQLQDEGRTTPTWRLFTPSSLRSANASRGCMLFSFVTSKDVTLSASLPRPFSRAAALFARASCKKVHFMFSALRNASASVRFAAAVKQLSAGFPGCYLAQRCCMGEL